MNAAARAFAKFLGGGLSKYDAGHIIGKLLGGLGVKGNAFPQISNINRGKFRVFEKEIADHIKTHGSVDVEINFKYENGGTRATDIFYSVYQNGKRVLYEEFIN